MAIIANSPSRKNGRHNDIVLGLRTVNKSQVRSAVKKIDLSTEHPEMFTSIELAKNLLTRSSGADEQTGGNLANIFILTPNLSRVPAESLRDKKVQIHIVNPGIIPWKGQENIDCNGWYLSSLERSNLDYLNQATDLGHESLLNTLRVAIRQCRTGSMAGVMRNLNLQIKPGMNCSIEGIMGRENLWSLRPGELITVLVKVRVGCFSSRSTSGTGTSIEESWGTSPNSNHLLNELNVILGASPITILTAKLSYTHSLFNYGTECVFRADCNVKNQMPWSGRAKDPSSVENATISQSKITIQKRLVFYLATQLSPSHAISTLNDHFGVGGVRSVCPIYIKLVMEELKYQAYVIEQLDYLGIPKELLEHENDPNQTLYEHFGEGYFEIPEFEPVGWTAHMTGKITDSGPGFGSPDLVSDSPTRIIPERKKILKSIKERIYISDAVERDDGSGGPISMEDPSSFRIHALLQQTVNDATLKSRPHVRIQDSLDGINLHLKQNGHSSRENRNPAQVHCLGGKYDVTTQEATSEHGRIMGDRGFDLLPSTVEASKENLNPNRKLKVTFQEQPRPKLEVPMRDRREEARKLWEKVSQRSHAETQRDLNQGLRAGKKVFIAKNVNDAARFLAENDMAAQINREADTMHREREAREKGEKNRWGKDRKK